MTNYQKILLLVFILAFLWSGINPPAGYSDWFLENSPIIVAIIALIFIGKYLKFSNVSYTLLTLYIMFPLVASHFGVSGVAFGSTVGHWLDSTRNMYDRVEHFMFGFLCFLPAKDIIMQVARKENFWTLYYLPVDAIISLSALYEIFEWLAAVTVNPHLAASFYASQGDIFDTPKDMANAVVGAIIASLLYAIYRYYRDRHRSLREKIGDIVHA